MKRIDRFRIVLKQLRKKKGFTQEKFAEKSSIDSKYYWRIEKGLSIPTINKMDGIYDALNLTSEEFWREVENCKKANKK